MEYFAGRNESKFTLRLHNNYTRFAPKHKKNDVIIPFITHTVWFTNPDKPRQMNYENVWEMVKIMQNEEDVIWQHMFWTNYEPSI